MNHEELALQLHELGIDCLSEDLFNDSDYYENTNIDTLERNVQFLMAKVENVRVKGVGYVACLVSESGRVYELIRTLRNCIYGKVKHGVLLEVENDGVYVRTQLQVAMKIMSKEIIDRGELMENPMIELAAQQKLAVPGHPNVLTMLECLQDAEYIFAVLPYCNGGELFASIETGGAMNETQSRFWFKQVVLGLEYLQQQGICHRDMSLENVLVHGDVCKIIDFGLAVGVQVNNHGIICKIPPTGAIGKVFYMAPEIYRNVLPYNGFAADIWSLGVMLFIMVTGAPPFARPDDADPRFQMIIQGRLSEMLDSWGMVHISHSVRHLLAMMLMENPNSRSPLTTIASHEWCQCDE